MQLPPSMVGWPCEVRHDIDAVLPTVDVVYLLRMQLERMTEALVPTLREYTSCFGLTARRVLRDGRKHLGFPQSAVEAFAKAHRTQIDQRNIVYDQLNDTNSMHLVQS